MPTASFAPLLGWQLVDDPVSLLRAVALAEERGIALGGGFDAERLLAAYEVELEICEGLNRRYDKYDTSELEWERYEPDEA